MVTDSSGTLHIVLSLSAPGLLRQALSATGRKDRVVGFPDCLACGPINPPAPASRLRWMVAELGYLRKDWDWLPRNVNAFWRRASERASRRIVWTSSRSANEHTAFLAWIERMDDQQYDVVDLADIEVTMSADDGRRRRDKALSLGMLGPDTIAAEALWDRAHPLNPSERIAHLEAWRRLRAEDAPLRVAGPDGVASAPISCFDAALMSHASDQWQRVVRLIGGVLADQGPYFQVGDHVLAARLVRLIASGKLECRRPATGNADDLGHHFGLTTLPAAAEVRLPRG